MKAFFRQVMMISFLILLTCNASASFNVYEFNDSIKEAQFLSLIDDLRCPKCQNNNLSDSNAPLATDIKNYVYKSVKSGKSDDDITEFLISRYGIFIIYDPKVMWLWLLPLLITVGGLVWAVKIIRSRLHNAPVELPSMTSLIAEHEQAKQRENNTKNTNHEWDL